jgi:hypothetical protein
MPSTAGVALLADWNGDGVATPGVFTDGEWLITNAAVGKPVWEGFASFGGAGDFPLTGERDGDGKADIATFRDGIWNWRDSTGRQETVRFGEAGDIPVVGDWNGDGVDEPGVHKEQAIRRHPRLEDARVGRVLHQLKALEQSCPTCRRQRREDGMLR